MNRSDAESPVVAGLNFLPVVPNESGGTETYARSLLRAIDHTSSDNVRYVVFLNEELSANVEIPPGVTAVNTGIAARHRPTRYAFEQLVLPWIAAIQDVDVLLCPGYVTPILSAVKTVPVIHDTNYRSVPETMSLARRAVLGSFVPLSALTAAAVVTVSEFSKSEVVKATPVDSSDVSVVHNPVPPTLPEPSPKGQDVVEGEYMLYVGNNYPHKNVEKLIEALQVIPEELSLVVIGFNLDEDGELLRRTRELGLRERVRFCAGVPQQQLSNLYAEATVYVHPSEYEGFGFPLIEAMYYDTPVVAHRAAAIPEVAGDAAVYFDDCSPQSISRAVEEARDEECRQDLVSAGRENLERFSLDQFADRIEEVLIEASEGSDSAS